MLLTFLLAGCAHEPPVPLVASAPEVGPRFLPLAGPAAEDAREYSGLAWCGDLLVLLAQYPSDALYVLTREQLAEAAQGAPQTPGTIAFVDGGASDIPGFEGYEALSCGADGNVWVTVEAKPGDMTGWLVPGTLDAGTLTLRPGEKVELPSRSHLSNKSDEALFVWQGQPWTLHEVNDVRFVPKATAWRVTPDGRVAMPAPALPYRLTDATPPDEAGIVWVINYQWSRDTDLRTTDDPIAARWGWGPSHAERGGQHVERLVALQVTDTGLTLADRAPIQLAVEGESRNWEGIARGDGGFYLVTDEHPHTLLAFVPAAP
jgi:hypothetical protein